MPLRRLLTAVVLTAAVLGLTACTGQPEDTKVHEGHTEGVYVSAGELKYQVQISRILNQYDWEDREYLNGLSVVDADLQGEEQWFGVFLRAFNITNQTHQSASDFRITDTQGNEYRPVPLDPRANSVAFEPGEVLPKRQLPLDNTLGRVNTTQGGLLLFKIESANFDNRPLILHVTDPAGGEGAEITLDV
jgi:hypothetical protein